MVVLCYSMMHKIEKFQKNKEDFEIGSELKES